MTDLQLVYSRARIAGKRHHAALREIARTTGIDEGTVQRCLKRAERADERDAKTRSSA